jgi:hypothetical protein
MYMVVYLNLVNLTIVHMIASIFYFNKKIDESVSNKKKNTVAKKQPDYESFLEDYFSIMLSFLFSIKRNEGKSKSYVYKKLEKN